MRIEYRESIWYTTNKIPIWHLIDIEWITLSKAIYMNWEIYENPGLSDNFPRILNYLALCKN